MPLFAPLSSPTGRALSLAKWYFFLNIFINKKNLMSTYNRFLHYNLKYKSKFELQSNEIVRVLGVQSGTKLK